MPSELSVTMLRRFPSQKGKRPLVQSFYLSSGSSNTSSLLTEIDEQIPDSVAEGETGAVLDKDQTLKLMKHWQDRIRRDDTVAADFHLSAHIDEMVELAEQGCAAIFVEE